MVRPGGYGRTIYGPIAMTGTIYNTSVDAHNIADGHPNNRRIGYGDEGSLRYRLIGDVPRTTTGPDNVLRFAKTNSQELFGLEGVRRMVGLVWGKPIPSSNDEIVAEVMDDEGSDDDEDGEGDGDEKMAAT